MIFWLSPIVLRCCCHHGCLERSLQRFSGGQWALCASFLSAKKGYECLAHFSSLKDVFRLYSSVSTVLARFWPFRLSSSPSPGFFLYLIPTSPRTYFVDFQGFKGTYQHLPREIFCNEEREVIRGSWLTKVVMRISMLISRWEVVKWSWLTGVITPVVVVPQQPTGETFFKGKGGPYTHHRGLGPSPTTAPSPPSQRSRGAPSRTLRADFLCVARHKCLFGHFSPECARKASLQAIMQKQGCHANPPTLP